jgi:transcriptional regulator with GAF, ATPase, and Fis domain
VPSDFAALLADLSTLLAEASAEAMSAPLQDAIGRAAAFFDLDFSWLAQETHDGAVGIFVGWTRPDSRPFSPFDARSRLPWLSARLREGDRVSLPGLEGLPREGALDRRFLEQRGIRSLLSLPLSVGGTAVGSLAFGALRESREWPASVVESLSHVAEIVGSAIARERAEVALQHATEFDRLVSELAASLMRVPADDIDSQIVESLRSVGALLGADRASVIQLIPDRMMSRTHLWVRAGTPGPPLTDPREAFEWMIARLFDTREVIALRRLDELPPEAATDRATLEGYSVVSAALAPMVVEDRVMGILSFATVKQEQQWSPDLIARLRLVGGVIGSALARRDAERSLRSALAENERLRERLEAENLYLKVELGDAREFGEIVGRSTPLRETLQLVGQVAGTDAPVLLLGETGTGKELLARAIHSRSRRSRQAFIAVNCAALPATLIEGELFGHDKGAFTGASHAKPGRFELADRGTLLLDEIGDLDPALQTKLLRVLEDGEIQRLGATGSRKVDVRIIAATNRDLRRDIREGRFRSDLYYRLGVFPIQVPPLRDRREDIPLLVWHFIQARSRAFNRSISKVPRAAMAALQAYDWPGNVRELQNVIERAMILSTGTVLRIDETLGTGAEGPDDASRRSRGESLQSLEHAHIVEVLERCRWTIEGRGQAAERLGLNPSTLRNRMRKLGIKRPAP